jgi:hypothetical protein
MYDLEVMLLGQANREAPVWTDPALNTYLALPIFSWPFGPQTPRKVLGDRILTRGCGARNDLSSCRVVRADDQDCGKQLSA